jgi:8-oxo-dGTP diphosphatase
MSEDIFHLGIKALIRDGTGKVLLLQVNPTSLRNETSAYWDLPGGRIQQGQTVQETLEREVVEETGITDVQSTKNVGMVMSNIRIPVDENKSVGLILSIYECAVPANSNVVLSNEHVAYEWFLPSEAAQLLAVKYPEHFCELVAEL